MAAADSIDLRVVNIPLGSRSYNVEIGCGLIASAGSRMAALGEISKIIVVTNPTVRALYGESLDRSFKANPELTSHVVWIELPDGEQFKNLDSLATIWDEALAARIDRRSVVVALGGGVIGDMAGFAASTLMRGIRFVQIPTTLLAQVDSSVGGKTGINRAVGKNLIGAFHQPSLVLADIESLTSLPDREYSAGLAEVVKYGVILDEPFFAKLESNTGLLMSRDRKTLADVVERSVELKGQVVVADEHEGGLRKILNFGHTVGHAIEQVTGYRRYLHGEAVAMGMGAAARISREIGSCGDDVVARVESLLTALGLAATIPTDLDVDALATAVSFDKKVEREHVAFIVCERLGAVRVEPLSAAQIAASLHAQVTS
jgi:3-dehydroquinate synthase